jgi:hypothetical protein
MLRVVLLLSVLLVVAMCQSVSASNSRPIIGILTQPSSASMRKFGDNYIAASYVKVCMVLLRIPVRSLV